MPFASLGARAVHYLDAGRGTPVVMVHSGGMSSRQWARLSDLLEPEHRVVVPDLLGYGESAPVPPKAAFDFSEDVDALGAVLDAVVPRGGACHLVGHSYGGLVALSAARRRPDRVLSLCLFEPVAFGVLHGAGDAEGLRELEAEGEDGVLFDDRTGGSEPWLGRFVDYWNGPGAFRALPAPTRQAFLAVGRKVFQEVRSLMADRTPAEAYATVRATTLLLAGARSTLAARRVATLLAGALPRAELALLEDVGHMGPLTHPTLVNARIADHIRLAEADPR